MLQKSANIVNIVACAELFLIHPPCELRQREEGLDNSAPYHRILGTCRNSSFTSNSPFAVFFLSSVFLPWLCSLPTRASSRSRSCRGFSLSPSPPRRSANWRTMRKRAKVLMARTVVGREGVASGSCSTSAAMEPTPYSDSLVASSPSEADLSAAAAAGCSELDQNLWPHLPDVLVDNVLCFLPAESVFKFRSVCKRWDRILTDPSFLAARVGAPHDAPFCVLADTPNKRFAVYNIALDKWYYPLYDDFFTGPVPIQRTMLTAAAAGLVLLEVLPKPWLQDEDDDADDGLLHGLRNKKSLLLVNPVNRSYRHLPDLQDVSLDDGDDVRFPEVVGIDYDSQAGSYQILAKTTLLHVGGLDNARARRNNARARRNNARPGRSQFHVYDLQANAWDMIYDSSQGAGPEQWDMSYTNMGPAVLHGGFWYYLTYAHRFWGPGNGGGAPHVFRVKKGVAEELQAPFPDEMGMIVNFLHIFACQGKLILAASLKTKDNLIVNEWMSFRFWLLDEETSEWVDYLRMPRYLVDYLGDRRVKRFALDLACSMDGDHICFWVGRPAGKDSRTIEMIIYSISKDSWWTVDSVVAMPRSHFDSRGQSCIGGLYDRPFAYFLFKPNLNITL